LENQDAYTESDSTVNGKNQVRLGQARATARVGYMLPVSWGYVNPYGWARPEYDVSKTPAGVIDNAGTKSSNSHFGTTFAVGTNVGLGDNSVFSLEGTTSQFRKNLDVYGVTGTVRFKF